LLSGQYKQSGTVGQRRIIEIHYPEFKRILEYAADQGKKIEPGEKEAWKAYVRKHNIPEAGFKVRANAGTRSGNTVAVIIEGTAEYDGYYLHSPDEQFCMKFESGVD